MNVIRHLVAFLAAGAVVALAVWLVSVAFGAVLKRLASGADQTTEQFMEAVSAMAVGDAKTFASKALRSRCITANAANSAEVASILSLTLAPEVSNFLRNWSSVEFGAGAAVIGQGHVRQREDGMVEFGYSEDGDRFSVGPNDETIFTSTSLGGQSERYAASIHHLVLLLDAIFSEAPVLVPGGGNRDI